MVVKLTGFVRTSTMRLEVRAVPDVFYPDQTTPGAVERRSVIVLHVGMRGT